MRKALTVFILIQWLVRIYRNANSVNAMAAEDGGGDPEWYLSLEMMRREETFRAVFFPWLSLSMQQCWQYMLRK